MFEVTVTGSGGTTICRRRGNLDAGSRGSTGIPLGASGARSN
jgi:hypothetical protein